MNQIAMDNQITLETRTKGVSHIPLTFLTSPVLNDLLLNFELNDHNVSHIYNTNN